MSKFDFRDDGADKSEQVVIKNGTAEIILGLADRGMQVLGNLPEDLRKRLGQSSTALVAVTPETMKSLKATFKKES